MLRKIEIAALFVLVFCLSAMAAQKQVLKIVPDPNTAGVMSADDVIKVEWVQLTGPGSQDLASAVSRGGIYFAASPAAGDLSRYTRIARAIDENVESQVGTAASLRSRFMPSQAGISHGAYYCIVASVAEDGDTLYSDYFTLMVETATAPTIEFPKANLMAGEMVATIPDLTPRFRWTGVSGVPYYHVILSDKPIISGSGLSSNISVIWQAITPATSIAYGAPDPSGTITAAPPPLTPGKTYSWMVLNNYGNHMAFSSSAAINPMDVAQAQFKIAGTPINAPQAVWPVNGDTLSAPSFEFRLTGQDSRANAYRIDLFTTASTEELGAGGLGDMKADLLVWTTTVSPGTQDALSVPFDAAGTLTGGQYTWRAYALDSRGAGSSDAASASSFYYKATVGDVRIRTLEMIGGPGGFASPVGFVEMRTEVLSGPTQAPLAFFTNNNGYSDRSFPYGRYRITAVKDGYNNQSITVNVDGTAERDTIFMVRPQAVIYGQALAADGTPLNLAKVTAVSEWGDTLTAFTGGNGSFTIGCNAAQWTITFDKAGYRTSAPRRVTLRVGDNRNFGSVTLVRNPNSLTGVVKNAGGGPLIGARVRVFTAGGVSVDELASTPDNGSFAFYLNSGTFVVTAEKAGFAMFSRTITVTGSTVLDITLPEGAALVNGVIIGKSWDAGRKGYVSAPVTSALIRFWDDTDTLMVTSDATFGRFSVSLPVGRAYNVLPSAAGFNAGVISRLSTSEDSIAASGGTMAFTDTLNAFLTIKGMVRDSKGDPVSGVDVFVNAVQGIIASGRTAVGGRYDIRNIPDNLPTEIYSVSAGRSGYYMTGHAYLLSVRNGGPNIDSDKFDFDMAAGKESIVWEVSDANYGIIKVVSPFHKTVDFNYSNPEKPQVARADSVGPVYHIIEAVAESDPNRLELSYHSFKVTETVIGVTKIGPDTIAVRFPFEHRSPGAVEMDPNTGKYSLTVNVAAVMPDADIVAVDLYHRSEGRTQFSREPYNIYRPIPVEIISLPVPFMPVRDGTDLFYYFSVRVRVPSKGANGAVTYDTLTYGSSKQIFSTFVRPEPTILSRVAVTPGVSGRDTLVMPSSYTAEFRFGAFYSDQFISVDSLALAKGEAGTVRWLVNGSPAGTGVSFRYPTPSGAENITLRAEFTPGGGYKMKDGAAAAVEMPVRVTGQALESITVIRSGEEGEISSGEQAGFRAQAFDRGGASVTVSPVWSVRPYAAGGITPDGTFMSAPDFFGTAMVTAVAGGRSASYAEQGEGPGQKVFYRLRRSSAAVRVSTGMGLGLEFSPWSIAANREAGIKMTVPELTNYVLRGPDGFRMADSAAFDVTIKNFEAIDSAVVIVMDVPAHLRESAASRSQEFMVAKWFSDSLMWIPIEGSEISQDGARVTAKLTKQGALPKKRLSKRAAAAAGVQARARALEESARYALVTKTAELSASMSISPHPFSPYIRPFKEYGHGAPAGTCVKVNVEAPEGSVRSVQVHVYNATGTRVWAVYRQNVPAGQTHQFWWNGRTSGNGSGRTSVSEVEWTPDMHLNADRPMCRNGRYFVHVTVTDMKGGQKRLMKPVVLMK
ncbi:MAG: carboxypeptidase-like regulatory domain-containing protein [Chitinispirillia bacterium]|nr:carboxypeptidase-like regulatory domain-containing protein [Chitinispirillia bacterium]MCL2240900.1 carboxypeptidase-like regulatory domain-containing protein [Chitinispirillia bacterium]